MNPTAGYIVVVVGRDGRVLHNPQHPDTCGEYPWDWCWNDDDRLRWRAAFIEACMFRRSQSDVAVSLRIHDKLFDYQTWLEPTGDDLVVCRLVRRFRKHFPVKNGRSSRGVLGCHSRQFVIVVSRIAVAPSASSRSMISITSLRLTIARTANQPASSSLLTVGDSKPGVIFSASASFASGTLYSSSE